MKTKPAFKICLVFDSLWWMKYIWVLEEKFSILLWGTTGKYTTGFTSHKKQDIYKVLTAVSAHREVPGWRQMCDSEWIKQAGNQPFLWLLLGRCIRVAQPYWRSLRSGRSPSCPPAGCRKEPGLWAAGWGCPPSEWVVCNAGTRRCYRSNTPPSGDRSVLNTSYHYAWTKKDLPSVKLKTLNQQNPKRKEMQITSYLLFSTNTAGLCWNSSFRLLKEQLSFR